MSAKRPTIAITAGDPAGIGPELVARLLSEVVPDPRSSILLVSSREEMRRGFAGSTGNDVDELLDSERVTLVEVSGEAYPVAAPEPSADGGAWSLCALDRAIELCEAGRADGVVFGPLNKTSLHLAGMPEPDELRWLERRLAVETPVSEVNINERFWTSRVTSHIAMRDVASSITVAGVRDACVLLASLLRATGLTQPRLGVAALNPHGGENGRFGDEEGRLIAPGIALARSAGVEASGPFPADTIFKRAFEGEFDGVVTMYHDQGQIALKTRSFAGGVTLEAGLPMPIATPAHGTAYDLVGTGGADLSAMRNAYQTVLRLAQRRA